MKTVNGYQRWGLKGSSDILGILPDGMFLAIEIKTGKAVQSKHQVAFMNRVRKSNGMYMVVRCMKDLEVLF